MRPRRSANSGARPLNASVRLLVVPEHERAWVALCETCARRGYAGLSAAERIWVNVRSVIDAVENGGCISYFYNSGADHLADCRDALLELGAISQLHELNRVAALFGPNVPVNIEDRNDVIANWDDSSAVDELLDQVDHILMPQMVDLEQRLTDFVEANSLAT